MKRSKWVIAGVTVVVLAVLGVAGWNYHEQPQFCATCHAMQPYLESWNGSELLAHTHAAEDIACLDCHEPTIQQQVEEFVANVTGHYSEPLRERKFPKEGCLACHEHGSYAELVTVTQDWERNPHNSHWGEMECYLCHNMHRPSVMYCAQCHDALVPEGWVVPEES